MVIRGLTATFAYSMMIMMCRPDVVPENVDTYGDVHDAAMEWDECD